MLSAQKNVLDLEKMTVGPGWNWQAPLDLGVAPAGSATRPQEGAPTSRAKDSPLVRQPNSSDPDFNLGETECLHNWNPLTTICVLDTKCCAHLDPQEPDRSHRQSVNAFP